MLLGELPTGGRGRVKVRGKPRKQRKKSRKMKRPWMDTRGDESTEKKKTLTAFHPPLSKQLRKKLETATETTSVVGLNFLCGLRMT